MKISIVGWYGKNNVGDDAFKVVFESFFKDHLIEFVTPPQICQDSDLVILGGGSVVSPFYLNSMPTTKKYALGVDIAYQSEIDLLEKHQFKEVYVRNSTDLDLMKSKLTCNVHSIPDLAFYLKPSNKDLLSKYKKYPNKKTVGVFATDYVNPAIDRPYNPYSQRSYNFKTKLADKIDYFQKDYEVILFPCSTGGYGDDRRINLDIMAYCKNQPTNVLDTISPQDMIDIIKDLDFSICMRFHSHIFSMIAGTPFLSIEFTRKVQLFLKENNLLNATAVKKSETDFDFSEFNNALLPQKEYLLTTAQTYRQKIEQVKQQVLQDWF